MKPAHIGWLAFGVTALRIAVSSVLGPGDSEALYAMYARHLALGHLDHPPLIGWLQRAAETLGPSELGIGIGLPHGLALRIVPIGCWLLSLFATRDLARSLWPEDSRAPDVAALAFIVCPLFLVGGMAASPDAPMSAAWLGALALAARSLPPPGSTGTRPPLPGSTGSRLPLPGSTGSRPPLPGSRRGEGWGEGRLAAAGALLGLTFLAKYSGALLAVAFAVFLASRDGPSLRRSLSTWIAAALALGLAAPPLVWNVIHQGESIRHRLDWTQSQSGFSLRNLGALLGGQLAYLTPLVALVGIGLLVFVWRARRQSPVHSLVALSTFVPIPPLVLLCLWSRVAEPHWMLPVWLALPAALPGALAIAPADRPIFLRPRFLRWAAVSGLALVALLHVHVLTDVAPRFLPASVYDPRFDLAHDLRGWPEVAEAVERTARREHTDAVLALHWTTCAQLDLALRARHSRVSVGCLTPERDDYDHWAPNLARRRDAIVVVDGRWTDDPNRRMPIPDRPGHRLDTVTLTRAGRTVRTFELWR